MLKYLLKTEKTAKSVDEAKALALLELGIENEEDAEIEVLDEGTKGFLGLGSKGAKVSASVKDTNAAVAKGFLTQVFEAMGIEAEVGAKTGEESLDVEISGERMGLVIGKRGDTLDALQYLTSLVVNHESDDRVRVILDTENYREKRLAEKVARTGKKHTLEPMNPYERRIIHANLQGNEDVTTFSIGEEPYRKLVIAPKNAPSHTHTPAPAPRPHISSKIAAEYRQQNHNKHKSFDEFLESMED